MFADWNQRCASCILFVWVLVDMVSVQAEKQHPLIENRMFPKDSFPTPTFDEGAPFCTFVKEPCGFYSFTINRKSFRWVKSWCRCAEDQECAFERLDMKMRVFRHSCVAMPKTNSTETETNSTETSERKHRHVHHKRHRRYHDTY